MILIPDINLGENTMPTNDGYTREDFDNESIEQQKARMAKLGKELDKGRTESEFDISPLDLNKSWSKEEKAYFLEKMKNEMVGNFSTSENWRVSYNDLWNEIYALWQSNIASRKAKTRTKIFIPIIFQVVEAAVPKFVNTLLATDDWFAVVPINPDKIELGIQIKKLLQYQLRLARFFTKFVDYVKQLLLYGTSYLKVSWVVKRKWVWTRTPIRENSTFLGFNVGSRIVRWEESKEYKVVERRPEIEVVDILDVYPMPEAEHEQDENYGFFIRSWITLERFKKLGAGKYPVFANTDAVNLDDNENKGMTRRERIAARNVSSPYVSKVKEVELVSYFGPYDVDGDGIEEEAHIVIANKSVVVKAQGNPFHHQKRPLIRGVLFPAVKEWYGIGLVEPVISLQHELNTLRRQRLDNINLIINRMWLIDGGADIDLDSLVSSPNGIITRDGVDSVEALETKDVTQSAYLEAQNVQTDIENTTTPRSVQGTPESGRLGRTARGAALIINQALEKFSTALRLTEEMVLEPMLNMMQQLNRQFIDDDQTLQDPDLYGAIFAEEKMTPEQIREQSRFEMKSISDMVNNEAQINQMISIYGVFKDIITPVSAQEILQTVWRLSGRSDKEVKQMKTQAITPLGLTGQQLGESIKGQVQNQGAAAPPQIPGVQPPQQ